MSKYKFTYTLNAQTLKSNQDARVILKAQLKTQ